MIIMMKNQATGEERAEVMTQLRCITSNQHAITTALVREREAIVLDVNQLDAQAQAALGKLRAVEDISDVKTPYQLVSRVFQPEDTRIRIGDPRSCHPVVVGDVTTSPVIIAGPCAVENREQLVETAQRVKAAGAHALRGGAFKPRTSPYQFQGLGVEGLHLLAEARQETGLPVVTEVMEPALVETVAEHADLLQIGSRNMQNYPLLLAVGRQKQRKPVLLKRGLSATIEEWLLAAEYIVAAGNPNIILCERGIRSYDKETRNVLDLTSVPLLHELTHLPIIVDPSHATGRSALVPTMSRASIAAGADGLLIEVHQDPNSALCDGRQSITPEQLQAIVSETHTLARMIRGERETSVGKRARYLQMT